MFIILYDGEVRIKKIIKNNYRYKGIEIEKIEDEYYFKLDYPYDLNEDLKIKYKKYIIHNLESIEKIIIYVYENDKGISLFNFYPNIDISIANNRDSSFISTDKYLDGSYLLLEDKKIITNYKQVLINDKYYEGDKLKHGDFISYLGIEIYYYNDFLYINNFNLSSTIKSVKLKEKTYSFKSERVKIANYYKRNYGEIVLKKLNVFNPPRKLNDKKIIYQIGPSITMSMAMISIAGINIYNSYINNGFTLSLIALGLMPLTIMISGIMWPILNRLSENRKYKNDFNREKEKYLAYLDDFEKNSLKEINRYINDEKYYAFNIDDILNKLFYINKNSSSFLTINIGTYSKQLDFNYDKTIDNEINERLIDLKRKLSSIGKAELFIDLKKDKRVSIISKNRQYYLLRILLELAYKYSPDDVSIAVYSKDHFIYETVYGLVHLYNGKLRMLFNDERDLLKLDGIDDSKKIILLADELVEIDNRNLIIINIVENEREILKYSDVVIEDYGVTSYLSGKKELIFEINKEDIDFKKYFDYLSNLDNKSLSNKIIRFSDSLNLYDDLSNNYLNHDLTLKAQFGYIGKDLIDFDIHESKDGPHGLIGGSTGSGKSELVISLLLSLAFRYPPDYLNIILIDYKGGGIKESLSYNGQSIPHIIASINNLEEGTFERLVVAIDYELKNRQMLFKKLSDLSSTSIMSLDDYLTIYKEYHLNPLAHLLIVVDEFAELKKENPEIIKELISFSRIGRSLGVHLILATQKPSGVIDDEIWSNSRFKIALKVHGEKDSQDLIKTKDAYYLSRPGEFYLKVDNSLKKGTSIYSKTDINNKDKYEVGILNKQLCYSYKKVIRNKTPLYESSYISKKIIETTDKLSITTKKIDYLRPAQCKLKMINKNRESMICFGIIDDYLNAKKGILKYDKNENIFIYSNRKNEVNNIINELDRLNKKIVLISDKKINHKSICDCIEYEDADNLCYLFNKLLKNPNKEISILIEDINSLISYDESYGDYLIKLTRRKNMAKYNFIVLSNNSTVNFKILNNFKVKLAIEINDRQDLSNIYSSKGNAIGRSYFFDETPIPFVPCEIEKISSSYLKAESFLDFIPSIVLKETRKDDIFIGYLIDTREKLYLKKDEKILITGFEKENIEFIKNFYKFDNITLTIYEDSLALNKYDSIIWLGDGIYSQRLFYPERNIELKEDVAYIYRNGKGRGIKLINHESNNSSFLYYV